MKAALAQLCRIVLQWLERDHDERDIVTQVKERWSTATTKRLLRASGVRG